MVVGSRKDLTLNLLEPLEHSVFCCGFHFNPWPFCGDTVCVCVIPVTVAELRVMDGVNPSTSAASIHLSIDFFLPQPNTSMLHD